MHRELSALFARENLSPDPNVTLMSATYLLVTVTVDKAAQPARSSDTVRTREKAVAA